MRITMWLSQVLLLLISATPLTDAPTPPNAFATPQANTEIRGNVEDLGLGPAWNQVKTKLPHTQDAADELEWPELWRLVQGTLRETALKGGAGAEAVTGLNGQIGYFGWPKNFEKYLRYKWDFGLGQCSVEYWTSRGKCVNGKWQYSEFHTTISFDPRDVSDISINYTGRSTSPTIFRSDDFDTIEINSEDKNLTMKTDDGTNYIFVDPDWLVNPNKTPEWRLAEDDARFFPKEQKLSTVEIPLMGMDKVALRGFAFLLARVLNDNGGNGIKVLN